MCHVSKEVTLSPKMKQLSLQAAVPVSASSQSSLETTSSSSLKLKFRPFRRIAKLPSRINLNRYWGFLSRRRKSSASSSITSSIPLDFSIEEEQNRINELLEAQANAEEQNSINSLIESESEPSSSPLLEPRRYFVRQRLPPFHQQQYHHSHSCYSSSSSEFNISQDSVFF